MGTVEISLLHGVADNELKINSPILVHVKYSNRVISSTTRSRKKIRAITRLLELDKMNNREYKVERLLPNYLKIEVSDKVAIAIEYILSRPLRKEVYEEIDKDDFIDTVLLYAFLDAK